MKKTKQTALTAAMFAAAVGMTACSKLPMQEVNSEPDIYYYSAEENKPVSVSLMRGDINGDGDITVEDAVLLQKYLKNQQTFTKKQFQRADLNQDGIVNVFDTVAQKRVLIYGNWVLEYEPEFTETTEEPTEEIPQPVYGPPEIFETTEPTETDYDPETDFPVDVYGPPWDFEETTELVTETIPQPVYGPPEIFETTEPTQLTETEYHPETEEQVCVYGPPEWFEETTEPPTEQLPQPEYGPPEIFE